MKRSFNAVNAAQAPVVEAHLSHFDPAKGTATSAYEGSREGEVADPRQSAAKSPGASASFAGLRRRVQQLERLLREQCDEQKSWLSLLTQECEPWHLHTPQSGLRGEYALLQNPKYKHLLEQGLRYRRLAYAQVLAQDLQEIQRAFPERNVLSLEELGEAFFALREVGIEAVTACAAVWQTMQGHMQSPVPQMGAMHHTEQGMKEYYTPGEVDRLTQRQLMDPRVMAAVEHSMTKWKKK